MQKKVILVFLLLSNLISAQETEIDSIISQEIKILGENKISSFFILDKHCSGCIKLIKENEKDCDYGTSKLYVFWKEKNEFYFRKINKCNYDKAKISGEIFINFKVKTERIKNETVKQYQTSKNSYISVSHSTFSDFYFIVNKKIEKKSFNHFYLTNDEEKPNINFSYNNSLNLIKLSKFCDEIILHNN